MGTGFQAVCSPLLPAQKTFWAGVFSVSLIEFNNLNQIPVRNIRSYAKSSFSH